MILFGVPKPSAILFPAILLCFFPLLLGIGWLLSAVGVVVRDISQLTTMLSHALLFLTPIFYSIDAVPLPLRWVLLLNPLTFVVEQLRLVLFFGEVPRATGLAVYFILSSLFALAALFVFRRLRPGFADQV
jgi:lipopolysaccharide transport system permease protein